MVEWTSLWSDSNAQFPVGPCEFHEKILLSELINILGEYGGPFGALLAGDTKAVFLLEEPEKIPRHNIYELVWFLKTGGTRMARMMLGLEPFVADINILLEGYQHYTRSVIVSHLNSYMLYGHCIIICYLVLFTHPGPTFDLLDLLVAVQNTGC